VNDELKIFYQWANFALCILSIHHRLIYELKLAESRCVLVL
jgi:hypothetical protein